MFLWYGEPMESKVFEGYSNQPIPSLFNISSPISNYPYERVRFNFSLSTLEPLEPIVPFESSSKGSWLQLIFSLHAKFVGGP